jgi:predicted nucleotidyltransferase
VIYSLAAGSAILSAMNQTWLTVGAIKAAAVSSLASGIVALKEDLRLYATAHGGSFWIYGSVARGDFRFNSDVDILVDFPEEQVSDAWRFAEDACYRHGLVPDVSPKTYCSIRFLERVMKGAVAISGER